jgi:hypothetical protein
VQQLTKAVTAVTVLLTRLLDHLFIMPAVAVEDTDNTFGLKVEVEVLEVLGAPYQTQVAVEH